MDAMNTPAANGGETVGNRSARHFTLQRERVDQLREQALAEPDPVDALVGADLANNALMELTLVEAINPILEKGVASLDELMGMLPVYSAIDRVSKNQRAAAILYKLRQRRRPCDTEASCNLGSSTNSLTSTVNMLGSPLPGEPT